MMRFVPIKAAQPDMILARDILSRNIAAMLRKGMQLTQKHIDFLIEHGYAGVYISDLVSEDIEIEETISDKVFRQGIDAVAEENIGLMLTSSTEIVKEIMSQKQVNVDLIDLRSFDDYTYHHSVNVAVYSVVVGKKMGLPEREIELLSQAAICHDLGKRYIPEEILNKPGKLTDEEYEIIKTHPRKSFEILGTDVSVSPIVKQAVLFHHENENGSGYPMKKTGDELSKIVKIIHAVDVYDALTSKRPYKEPYAPADAFEYLKNGCDILFDREVVDAMLESIPAYPPGIDVTLSNGETGIVMGHTTNALRPKIKMIDSGQILDLNKPENNALVIVKSGIMPADYSAEVELLNEKRNGSFDMKKQRIMLVDEMINSMVQIMAVLNEKYEISTFQSGIEALKDIQKNGCPDLIIFDIDMPVMDGFTFLKAVERLGYKDVPAIILTARTDKETVRECIKMKAKDYIVKPVSPVYLRERVEIVLNGLQER